MQPKMELKWRPRLNIYLTQKPTTKSLKHTPVDAAVEQLLPLEVSTTTKI